MRTKFAVPMTVFALFCSGASFVAHHSFATEYDGTKTFSIQGRVSKVEWTNPHVRFYIDVTGEKGEVATWNIELGSPNVLVRNGWTSRILKIGDSVTVKGYAARVAPNRGTARLIVTASGKSLFAGILDGNGPATAK